MLYWAGQCTALSYHRAPMSVATLPAILGGERNVLIPIRSQDEIVQVSGLALLKQGTKMVSDKFSDLVCPLGKAPLRREGDSFVCTRCGPRFKITNDIPNMLIEEAALPADCSTPAELPCVRAGDARLDIS